MTIDKDKFLPPYDPSGKFKFITPGEMVYPASCFACGSISDDNQFIDTGIQIDWVGAIYFCGSCCINIGQALGCMAPKASLELIDIAISQANELKNLGERCDKLESALDAVSLDRLRDRQPDFISAAAPDVLEDSNVSDDSKQSEGSADSVTSESSTVDGPNDTGNDKREHGLIDSLDL
jgi:hypothetical protein